MSQQTSAEPQMSGQSVRSPKREAPGFVSIILPHYNDLENLKLCIALLEKQSFPRERFEIVVAENNSACGFDAVVQACGPGVFVIPAPLQGAAEARNAAIRAAKGDILAFIDSDCRPALDWLERGVAALDKGDLVGGCVDVDVGDPAHPTAVEAFELVFAFDYRRRRPFNMQLKVAELILSYQVGGSRDALHVSVFDFPSGSAGPDHGTGRAR